jgi:predicted dehydrogenase
MKSLGIGVIGLGAIGGKHVSVLKNLREANIVGVSDLNQELVNKTIAGTTIQGYTDYRELLARPDLDAVIIATPDHLHKDITIEAAQAGKHVLVEKPIATTVEDGEAMIEAAKKANVKLMVGFTLRFVPHYVQAREIIQSGKLGKIVSVYSRRMNVITQADRLGGRIGVLHFLGIHDFDLLHWLLGVKPDQVYTAESTSVEKRHPQENETFNTFKFKDGTLVCAHIGWNLTTAHPGGRDFKLTVIGDKGSLDIDLASQGLMMYSESGSKFPSTAPGLDVEDKAFIDCVLDDKPVPSTGEDGITALKMVLAAIESIEKDTPVKID